MSQKKSHLKMVDVLFCFYFEFERDNQKYSTKQNQNRKKQYDRFIFEGTNESHHNNISCFMFQLSVTMFLMCDVLGTMWKRRLSMGDQNILNIAYHIAEVGCALWFPCCLWNVNK